MQNKKCINQKLLFINTTSLSSTSVQLWQWRWLSSEPKIWRSRGCRWSRLHHAVTSAAPFSRVIGTTPASHSSICLSSPSSSLSLVLPQVISIWNKPLHGRNNIEQISIIGIVWLLWTTERKFPAITKDSGNLSSWRFWPKINPSFLLVRKEYQETRI